MLLFSGKAHNPTCPGCSKLSSLSEVTTIQLEFNELTRLTKDVKYKVGGGLGEVGWLVG